MICNPVIAGGGQVYKIMPRVSSWFQTDTAKSGERVTSNEIVDGDTYIVRGVDGSEIPRIAEEQRPGVSTITFIMPNQDVVVGT